MRFRLVVVLAVAAAAVIVVLLQASRPDAPQDRSHDRAERDPAMPEEPQGRAPEVPGPTLRVFVCEDKDFPISGARCAVDTWKAAAETDALGFARIPVPAGASAEFAVRASKGGYRPATRRGRFAGEDGTRVVKIRLLKAPPVRVFGRAGDRVTNVLREPAGADLREQTLRATGYLDLDLRDLAPEMLRAWDDLLGTAPVDLFLVPDAGLACTVLRVVHPDGAVAAVGIDLTRSALPDLAPHLRSLPSEWRSFYAARWPESRSSPRLPAKGPGTPATLRVNAGEEIRVYAEQTIVVTCMATDCRPIRQEIDVPPGGTVERTLSLVRETWAGQEIVVVDRYGRPGRADVELLGPVRFPLGSFESQVSTLRVPRGGGPYLLAVNGGARGRAVQTVETLPRPEPIRFELKGVEVRLRLIDDETGEPVEDLGLHLEGREDVAVQWKPEEGVYVFGPVDPGTIGVAHDPERRFDLRVEPKDEEKGVVRQEVRVRGFPKREDPASEPE